MNYSEYMQIIVPIGDQLTPVDLKHYADESWKLIAGFRYDSIEEFHEEMPNVYVLERALEGEDKEAGEGEVRPGGVSDRGGPKDLRDRVSLVDRGEKTESENEIAGREVFVFWFAR